MKVKFYTLGCKVNQYETQSMRELFYKKGFIMAEDKDADITVVNSCSVTSESDRKTRQLLSRIRRENKDTVIVLTGCMPQAYPEEAKNLDADLIIGNANTEKTVNEAIRVFNEKIKLFDVKTHETGETYTTSPITNFEGRTRAFMKIEDGCDRFCSYCVIPYARGRVRSRSIESIKKEAEILASNGFCEIVMVGINLSAYGKDNGLNLCDAVDAVCEAEGIKRVRLGSLEPDHITDEMLERFKNQEKFCPQFHLSLQSGCDDTLKRMNRHYDSAFYFDLINRIRKIFPDAAITTDIMVGFAGETEEEFNKSLEFVKMAEFSRSHVFSYSIRKGTIAAKLPKQVTNAEKTRRSHLMIAATQDSETKFLKKQIGKTLSVLFETENEGYTKNYLRVILQNEVLKSGEITDVKIISAENEYLIGKIDK